MTRFYSVIAMLSVSGPVFAMNCPDLFKNERIVSFKKGSGNNELFLVYRGNNKEPTLTRKVYGEAKQRDNDLMGFYLVRRILNSQPVDFQNISVLKVLSIQGGKSLDLQYKEGVSLDLLLERKHINKLNPSEARKYIELSENVELQRPATSLERKLLNNEALISKINKNYLDFLDSFSTAIKEQALKEGFQKLEIEVENPNTNNGQISVRYRPKNANKDYFLFLKSDNILVDANGKLTIIDPY